MHKTEQSDTTQKRPWTSFRVRTAAMALCVAVLAISTLPPVVMLSTATRAAVRAEIDTYLGTTSSGVAATLRALMFNDTMVHSFLLDGYNTEVFPSAQFDVTKAEELLQEYQSSRGLDDLYAKDLLRMCKELEQVPECKREQWRYVRRIHKKLHAKIGDCRSVQHQKEYMQDEVESAKVAP
eukprot:m51a1_g6207 hypothetical protein (181) ;mRNA; f:144989-147028